MIDVVAAVIVRKPLPIEGVGLGWFAVGRLRAIAATGLLTIPTKAVIEALIAYASRA